MDKSKIVPEIHRYMVCDLQAPMMLSVSQQVTELVRTPGTFLFSGSFFDFGVI